MIPEQEFYTAVYNSDCTLTEISRFQIPFRDANVVGLCNGIYCLCHYLNHTICLWNPSTKKFKMVIAPVFATFFPSFAYGLAYHSQNNDIKVLSIAFYRGFPGEKLPRLEAVVFTLSTDLWREVVILVGSFGGSFLPIQEKYPFISNKRMKENPCVFLMELFTL